MMLFKKIFYFFMKGSELVRRVNSSTVQIFFTIALSGTVSRVTW